MAELCLTALDKGIEKFPDEYLDKVPPFRPPKERRQDTNSDKRREQRDGRQSSSINRERATAGAAGAGAAAVAESDSYNKQSSSGSGSPPQQALADAWEEGYRKGRGSGEYESRITREQSSSSSQQNNDTRSRSVANQDYRSSSRQQTDTDTSKALVGPTQVSRSGWVPSPPPPIAPPSWSAMDNYSNYAPPQGEYRRYDPSNYAPASSGPNDRYNDSRRDSYARDDESGYYDNRVAERRKSRDGRSRRRHSGSRSQSRSRSGSRSGSRERGEHGERGWKDKVESKFDPSKRGLLTGAIGAVAGGWLAHEVAERSSGSHGRGKSGHWPAVAGAVVGALGANAWEAHESRDRRARSTDNRSAYSGREIERRDSRRGDDRDSYYSESQSRAVTGPYRSDDQLSRSRSQSGYGDRGGDSEEDDYDDRRAARREERRRRKEREARYDD